MPSCCHHKLAGLRQQGLLLLDVRVQEGCKRQAHKPSTTGVGNGSAPLAMAAAVWALAGVGRPKLKAADEAAGAAAAVGGAAEATGPPRPPKLKPAELWGAMPKPEGVGMGAGVLMPKVGALEGAVLPCWPAELAPPMLKLKPGVEACRALGVSMGGLSHEYQTHGTLVSTLAMCHA